MQSARPPVNLGLMGLGRLVLGPILAAALCAAGPAPERRAGGYLDAINLVNAWMPPPGSPFAPEFVRYKTASSVRFRERAELAKLMLKQPKLLLSAEGFDAGPGTAVVVDCEGPRSVALAAWLVKARGYQPVIKLDAAFKGSNPAVAVLAQLIHHAEEMERSRGSGKASAPPVFILDSLRAEPSRGSAAYRHSAVEFPDRARLKKAKIERLVYLSESGRALASDLGELRARTGLEPTQRACPR